MIKSALLAFIKWYAYHFPFPKKGQKYFLRILYFNDLLQHKFIRKLRGGIYMNLANVDHIEKELFWYSVYESKEIETLLKFVTDKTVFIDAGANLGYYSLRVASRIKSCLVYSFEPVSSSFQNMQSNISLNKFSNIIAEQIALSNKSGRRKLFIAAQDNMGMSSFTATENESSISQEVETVPLESYAKHKNFSCISVIKIDVEGAELEVLEGLKSLLHRDRPVIAIELSEELQKRSGHSIYDIHEYFKAVTYKAFEITAPCSLQPLNSCKDCNLAIFIPAEKKIPAGISLQFH